MYSKVSGGPAPRFDTILASVTLTFPSQDTILILSLSLFGSTPVQPCRPVRASGSSSLPRISLTTFSDTQESAPVSTTASNSNKSPSGDSFVFIPNDLASSTLTFVGSPRIVIGVIMEDIFLPSLDMMRNASVAVEISFRNNCPPFAGPTVSFFHPSPTLVSSALLGKFGS